MVDAARQNKRDLFNRDALAAELSEHFTRPFNALDLELDDFEYDVDRGLFTFHVDSIGFEYRFESRQLVAGDSIPEEERLAWATYSPDSTWIAFSRQHNLYLMRADDPDSTEIQLTADGERWYSYQASDGDTTTTKRLRSRANWFEDEKKLYARRPDRREIEDLWVINSLGERPTLETYKYPMAGDEEVPQDEIWVFDVESQEGVRLDNRQVEGPGSGRCVLQRRRLFPRRRRPITCTSCVETGRGSMWTCARPTRPRVKSRCCGQRPLSPITTPGIWIWSLSMRGKSTCGFRSGPAGDSCTGTIPKAT